MIQKICVNGSREVDNKSIYEIWKVLSNKFEPVDRESVIFIVGGARGVNTIAEDFARSKGFTVNRFIPNWNFYGKKAGFIRNEEMVEVSDKLISFWDGKSRGTKHAIDLASKKGIPIEIFIF